MTTLFRGSLGLILVLTTLAGGCAGMGSAVAPAPGPGSRWQALAEPDRAGWSAEGLIRARTVAENEKSAAVIVVEDGLVVAAWGEIDRPLPLYSMRKGIYNALAGMLAEEGRLDPAATLADLGIDDLQGLSERERRATVGDLLASRSGIYHPSAYEPASMKRNRPERGAHAPGEAFFYNNWDFNVVAHLIERAGGQDFDALFRDRLAVPLGMEDWSGEDLFEFLEPSRSRFPAHVFRMSARDLARFGQLYLQRGRVDGRSLLSEEWIAKSWTRYTTFDEDDGFPEGAGFGYLWWIHPRRADPASPFQARDVVLTRGSDGQMLAVIPELKLVIVHQTDTENGMEGSFEGAVRVLEAILEARTSGVAAARETTEVEAVPFAHAKPAPVRPDAVPWTKGAIAELTGVYALRPGMTFRVHAVGDRLFALPQGIPLAEVELFRTADGMLFSPVLAVRLNAVRDDSGTVTAIEGTVEGRPMRIERAAP